MSLVVRKAMQRRRDKREALLKEYGLCNQYGLYSNKRPERKQDNTEYKQRKSITNSRYVSYEEHQACVDRAIEVWRRSKGASSKA